MQRDPRTTLVSVEFEHPLDPASSTTSVGESRPVSSSSTTTPFEHLSELADAPRTVLTHAYTWEPSSRLSPESDAEVVLAGLQSGEVSTLPAQCGSVLMQYVYVT